MRRPRNNPPCSISSRWQFPLAGVLAYCPASLCCAVLILCVRGADAAGLHLGRLPAPVWQREEEQWIKLAPHADGRWLLRMALAAGGCDDFAAERYEQRLQGWVGRVRQQAPAGPAQRAALALELLHREVLRAYRSDADRLHETFEQGEYNCVTAAVLYVCLCESLGVKAAACQAPEHVACRVFLDGQCIMVEPTSPRWPGLATAPSAGRNLAPGQDVLHGPRREQAPWRELSSPGLASAVYYNMGSRALLRGHYAAALQANHKALLLDPQNEAAARNLLAAINNWAVAEAEAGRPQAAARLLRLGLEVAPEHAAFQKNLQVLLTRQAGTP